MTFATYEKNGRVAVITLNRPESRNAIATPQDCADVVDAIERANADRDVVALILTGAGKSFCAGGDLKSMRERTGIGPQSPPDATAANYRNGIHKMIRAIAETDVATIAAFNGHAIGLGLDIGVICDMRLAGASAKMASSFAKVGLIPGDGGAWILTNAIGSARAAELILTGDTIDADEACRIGLVSRVVPDDQLLAEANKLAERVAVNPPRAVRLAKRLLRESRHGRFSDVMELSAAFQALAHETEDHKEAVDAFSTKRAPNFTGN
jgi:enoyl-CoA hydratase/carnithine racemase